MITPTDRVKRVTFEETSLKKESSHKVNTKAKLPHCHDPKYLEICAQINQVFTEYEMNCADQRQLKFSVRQSLCSRIKDILQQLDDLPDKDDLTLRVLKVVTARIGVKVYLKYNIDWSWRYLQIVQQNQSYISQLATPSTEDLPWWEDLDKHWKCFFALWTASKPRD